MGIKFKKAERITEYDILRVIVTALVLISHCKYYQISTKYGGVDYNQFVTAQPTAYKLLTVLITMIYSFHMPLFMALSGALFYKQFQVGKFKCLFELIRNKFYRLMIPFLVVTCFYSVPIKCLSGYFKESTNIYKDVFAGQVLLQGNSHLWFLEALFVIFALIYLMEKYVSLSKCTKFFILLIVSVVSVKIPISIIQYPLNYAVWFYMGYCFEPFRKKYNKKNSKLITFIAAIAFTMIFVLVNYIIKNNQIVNVISKILLVLLGCFITYNISYLLAQTNITKKWIYKKVLKNSFGLYLYSDPWNYVILYIFSVLFPIPIFNSNIGSVLIFVIRLIVTSIIAYAVSEILRKIHLKNLY